MYLFLGIVFLILEILIFSILIITCWKKKLVISKNNIFYLIPVFLLIYLIYLTGAIYNKENIDFMFFFNLIGKALGMFGFKIETDYVYLIAQDYIIYFIDIVLLSILSILTILISVFSIFKHRILHLFRKRKVLKNNGDIIIGYSSNALKYLATNPNSILWDPAIDNEQFKDLISKNYCIYKSRFNSKAILKILNGSEYHFIAFRDSKYSYSKVIDIFTNLKNNNSSFLYLHLESTVEEMKIVKEKYIDKIEDNTNIFVTCFNKYELMARDFIKDYPITKYIPKDFYNTNFTLKKDKEINIVFLGFGKVNYELFKLMAMQFQFAKETNNKELKSSLVNYYVYDFEEEKLHNESFSKILYEYNEVFKDSDLPPIHNVCNLKTKKIHVDSIDLKKEIKEYVHKDSYTFFIISLSSDFENAAYAENLYDFLNDFNENFKIFVRIKENKIKELNTSKRIIYFGEEKKILTHSQIVNEDLIHISNLVHNAYVETSSNHVHRIREWESLPIVEQYSNIYSALSIFFKLGLLGFTVKKEISNEEKEVTLEDFQFVYGKPGEYNDYNFFFENNPKNVLAYIEHARWNAYYFLSGYKPMKFNEFYYNDIKKRYEHKDIKSKKHACLTTYKGLDTLIKKKYIMTYQINENSLIDENSKEFLKLADIYVYDYMVMDRIYPRLKEYGFKIVYTKK